jgi:hypothetical protein
MLNRVSLLFCSLALLVALDACEKGSPTEPPGGTFSYRAYDTTGTLIVQGWFTLNVSDSANVQGEWHFTKVGNPSNIGLHFGDGELKGSFYQSRLSVGLNPNYVDNNVILSGTLDAHSYSGTWRWIGFPGEINRGTFEAQKSGMYPGR